MRYFITLGSFLEKLFAVSLWVGALHLVAIALLVGSQVVGRIIDKGLVLLGIEPINFVILSIAEIAGYLLAGASFLALAGTFKAGAHIRVMIVLQNLHGTLRQYVELLALAIAFVFSCYMSYWTSNLVAASWSYGDVSVGVIPIPLYIPQCSMAAGAIILSLAIAHEFFHVLRRKTTSFTDRENATSLANE